MNPMPLPPSDRHQVLVEWNATDAPFPHVTVHQLFVEQARRTPDAVAVICGDERLTYAQLDARSNQIAHSLLAHGVRPGTRVALLTQRSLETVLGIYGILKAGAAYVPLDPAYPSERLQHILKDCGAEILLVHAATRGMAAAPQQLSLSDAALWNGLPDTLPEVQVTPDDPVYVIYTSGSTGTPKGTLIFHRGVVNLYCWYAREFRLHAGAKTMVATSVGFDLTQKDIHAPLLHGGSCVLLDASGYDPARILDTIEHEGCTFYDSAPSAFYGLVDYPGARTYEQLRSLKTAFLGGEALSPRRLRSWLAHPATQAAVVHGYGPTECSDALTFHWLRPEDYAAEGGIPIGRPLPNVQLYVLDEHLQPVAIGDAGELCAAGVCVGGGYLNQPEKTASVFVANPFGNGLLYRTGDRVRYTPEGLVVHLGRIDQQVKVRGFRIEPGEIEAALLSHPAIAEAVVLARADRGDEPYLAAYTVHQAGLSVGSDALRTHLAARLPEFMLPAAFITLPALPLNTHGKVDRHALPAPGNARPPLATAYRAPRPGLQQQLAMLWAQVLLLDRVGADDRFFELGGSSLKAVQVVGELSQRLGERLAVSAFFAAPTVTALAAHIQNQHPAALARWLGDTALPQSSMALHPTNNTLSATPMTNTLPKNQDGIALVGLACKTPGAADLNAFWQLLMDGGTGLKRLSEAELDALGVPSERRANPDYVPVVGWPEHADCFDASFFGYTPMEASLIDPQQRLLLETAWTALEHAGMAVDRINHRVAVYASVAANSYYAQNVSTHPEHRAYIMDYATLGADKDYAATRIAFKLDLRGPAMSVQAACASSGLAIHLACQSLRMGECDVALAGGAALPWSFSKGYESVAGGALSRDGSIRAFDAASSGMVLTGGAAVVVMKRVADALADGDTIYAVVRGSAINNDGGDKVAYTAPSVAGQTAVIQAALAKSGIGARQVSYVEAHGTGTPLGDPIEVAALTAAYRTQTSDVGYCAIGSVKTNIGHLDAAAAAAGLIKTTLALHHQQLPASLHFTAPNPECGLAQSPFTVNASARSWKTTGAPRRAGLSSFGFGGSNFHALIEEAPASTASTPFEGAALLRLSAKTTEALATARTQLADWLLTNPQANLADVAYTLDVGRARFAERSAVLAVSNADAANSLRSSAISASAVAGARLVFGFPGQGAQHPGMGEGLYRQSSAFREAMDACADFLAPRLGVDLRDLLYADHDHEGRAAQLRNTQLAQPAIFAVSYATAQHWLAQGYTPAAMIGHSVGEVVAATLAGVFTLEDALTLLVERAKLMQSMASGGMMAVRLSETEITPWLGNGVDLAGINAPKLVVVSGPHAALDALKAQLEAQDIGCTTLHTSHAFHSAMMAPVVAPFAEVISRLTRSPAQQKIVSIVTGDWATDEELQNPHYWAQQIRQPVRFSPALTKLLEEPGVVLLECGPGQNLTTSARQHGANVTAIATLPHAGAEGANAHAHALEAAARLWLAGIEAPAAQTYAGQKRRKVGLPGYAFARTRHWVEPLAVAASAAQPAATPAAAAEVSASTAAAAAPQAPAAPADPTAQLRAKLMDAMEDVTGARMADHQLDENWLSIGMDSLLLTQVAGKLKVKFRTELKFRDLLETHTSFNKLAAHLLASSAPIVDTPAPAAWDKAPEKAGAKEAKPGEQKAFGAQTKINRTQGETLNARQQAALDQLTIDYVAKTPKSKEYTQKYRAVLSDARTVSGFRPLFKEIIYPIVVERSKGAYLWDTDGNRYLDITNGYGCIFFGNTPDFVIDAVKAQLDKGFEIGPQSPLVGPCAEAFSRFTGMERVCFTITGSDAVLAAMRMARTVTGRNLIVCHTNDYHGIQDEVIVRPGPDGRGMPASAGILRDATRNMVVLDYGNPKNLEFIRNHGDDIAAVLVEPVQSRNCDLQPADYMRELRVATEATGSAFIMDEVITGFRSHLGGAQAYFGVKADLASYGKVIGGGMPIGVVAGSAKYMDALDGGFWRFGDDSFPEAGVTFFAGTFVRHPVVMAAVKAVCDFFDANPDVQTALNARTAAMVQEINAYLQRVGAPVHVANFTSLFRPQYTCDQPYGELFYAYLRMAGIHIYEGRPCYLTLAHTDADVEAIIRGFRWATEMTFKGDFFTHSTHGDSDVALAIAASDPYATPVRGARIGKQADGSPGWFLPDPARPGKYKLVRTAAEGTAHV